MKSVIWVLVSTASRKQAESIGKTLLKRRLAACYALYPKIKSVYFWPAGPYRLEQSYGPLLVLETLPKKYLAVTRLVKSLHSDSLPFIGKIKIDGIGKDFYNWMHREIV